VCCSRPGDRIEGDSAIVADDEAGPVVVSLLLEDHPALISVNAVSRYAEELHPCVTGGDAGNATTRIHLEPGLAASDSCFRCYRDFDSGTNL
jgi:hypothetical protein